MESGRDDTMKSYVLAAISTVAFAGTASAAHFPAAAPHTSSWSGFYAGVNGGVAWLHTDFNAHDPFVATSTASVRSSGGTLGGEVGYNWQLHNFVLGLEGDWDWVDASGSASATGSYVRSKLSSMATIRARAGVLLNPATLVYVTGGYAWGHFDHGSNALGGFTDNGGKSGWTLGGGVEYKFAPHWSVKAEALYADFGRSSVQGYYGSGYGATFKDRVAIARVGLNFDF